MEDIQIRQEGCTFVIEGFPNAVKVFSITDERGKRLSDLALHKADLEYCLSCLNQINQNSNNLIRRTLWEIAIIYFMKCFGNSESRFSLSFDKIFKNDNGPKKAFDYFKDLRNKHFIHDENSYSQSLTGVILNKETEEKKIAKIVTTIIESQTLEQDNYSNLTLLIQKTKEWVVSQYEELCEILTNEYEKTEYKELIKIDGIQVRIPTIDEKTRTRK
jgi:hypothetical protein